MTTDAEGFNSFIHVLIFYEEINEAEINSEDFDIVAEILRKQHQSKKTHQSTKIPTGQQTQREGSHTQQKQTQLSSKDLVNDGQLFQRNVGKSRARQVSRKPTNCCLNARELKILREKDEQEKEDILESPATPKGFTMDKKMKDMKMKDQQQKLENRKKFEEDKKRKMENIISNIQHHGSKQKEDNISTHNMSYYGQVLEPKLTGGNQQPLTLLQSQSVRTRDQPPLAKGNQSYVVRPSQQQPGPRLPPRAGKQNSSKQLLPAIVIENESNSTSKCQESEGLNETVNFGNVAKNVMKDGSRPVSNNRASKVVANAGFDDYYGICKQKKFTRFGQTQIGHHEEPLLCRTGAGAQDNQMDFPDMDEDYFLGNNELLENENDQRLQEMSENKRYVPVALCLETETEYHDTFRQIMLSLFDMIRVPENLVNRVHDNRTMAFAELISHLAFLRTIPAPPFNSVYNIHLMNQVFTIKEQGFDQLPNKNSYPIKILFDVLDVRSIFYCWKALLFDKTLVLVSSQYSLQFYIAEALKQLLFPMTWQNTYIQPGNESLAGHCDGTMVCLYGSNSMVNGFDFFEAMQHPEICICDIDAGFTNNIDLPCIPDETMYIRILNMLKNQKINQYDKAYPDSQTPDTEDFVSQVKETFFSLLKPFLSKVEDFIDTTIDSQQAFFQKYFKEKEYLEHFENYGKLHLKFAQALTQSSQFQHFCDDFFSEEDMNNYKMLQEIYKSRGEIHHIHQTGATCTAEHKKKPSDSLLDAIRSIEEMQKNKKTTSQGCQWPDTEPVTFNFRLPCDHQRVMLFEKMLYMIESSLRKKEKDLERKTNEHLINNKDSLLYDKVIQTIKTLYPVKLKGTHKKFQQQDAKMYQVQIQRKLGISTIEMPANKQLPYAQGFQRAQDPHVKRRQSQDYQAVLDAQTMSFIEQKVNKKFQQSNVQKSNLASNSQYSTPNQGTNKSTHKEHLQIQDIKQNLLPAMNDRSQARIPLDLLTSQDDLNPNSSITLTQDTEYIQYIQAIEKNKQRIAKIMYGRLGLICFLQHLFGLLGKQQMLRVNYYFAMKQQIASLNTHAKKLTKHKEEQRKNKPIPEEGGEEEKSPTYQRQVSPQSSSMGVSHVGGQKSHNSQTFHSEKEWLQIDHWDSQGAVLKHTYQFSLFSQKMFESFENPEDGYTLVWKSLLKFPTNKMKFFPTIKFMQIWDSLTQTQQQELFVRLGQRQDKPQIQLICKQFVKQRNTHNRSTQDTTNTSGSKKVNEEILYNNCIEKTWKQKQIEKRESLLAAKSVQPRNEANFSLSTFSPKDKDSILKQEAKKQKVIDSNQRNIQDYLKKRLEMKSFKSQEGSIDTSKLLKAPPLSARSMTSEQFTFAKQPSGQEIDSPSFKMSVKMPSSDSSRPTTTKSQSVLQHKKSDSNVTFVPMDYKMGDMSVLKPDSQKIKPLTDPVGRSQRMIQKMVEFWKKYSPYVSKSGGFREAQLDQIQEELKYIDKRYISRLKSERPQLEGSNTAKQCFFLNVFNFLVLHQLAVLMLTNPDAVSKLNNYNLWQSFLISASIKIAYTKLTAFSIMHSILRHSLKAPLISAFMVNSQSIDCQELNEFKVVKPSKLICFGFYLPLKKMPEIRFFNTAEFEDQLRLSAQQFLVERVKIKEDQHLIVLPKMLQWYAADCEQGPFVEMLKFIENRIFQQGDVLHIKKVLNKIAKNQSNAADYIIEYQNFSWVFDPMLMATYFADKHINPFMTTTQGND